MPRHDTGPEWTPAEYWEARAPRRTTKPLPDPDGCRWCGDARHHHGWQWIEGGGHHQWTPPTDRMRLERMHARRDARLARKAAVR